MIVIVFLWLRLGDMQYVARGHRIIIEDALDKRAQVGVTRTAPDWTDDLFLSWARQHPPLGVQRYVWASLYATFGGVFSYWLWILAGLVAGSVVLGLAPRPVAEIAFASLGFAAVFVDLPATSNMLLPGGRHERYYATVIATVVTTLLLLILAVGIAALSETIGIGLGAGAESFGFRFHSVWLVCVFVPWIVTLQLCGRRFRRIESRTPAIAVGLASLMVLRLFFAIHRWPAQKCLLFFAGVFVCGWAFFLLTTGHLCVGGSLVERRLGAGG
ncbi:MAG: hypothetical protein JW741_15800 [Sedimentisphaerales bacterium]|nr:hypothetical protein [Sedimentisphaerales bacterium]